MNKRQAGLGFIFVTLFIDILGIGLIIPILPKLIESFEGGNTANASLVYGGLVAVYALMQFVFAPLLGALSDRYGRRPVILLSLLGLGLDYILLSFAPNLWWLVVGRVIAGIFGASTTAALAYIADITPPEKRAQSFGLVGAAFGLGFIVGPLLGGVLGSLELRLPFMVAAGLSLVNFFYGLLVLPESLKPKNRRLFNLAQANPIGAFAVLRKYPMVLGLVASFFLVGLANLGLQNIWVLYTGYRYQWGVAEIGISLAVVGVASAVVQGGLIGVIIKRLGEPRALLFGLIFGAASCVLFGLATQGWMIYAITVVSALGSIAGPALQGMISGQVAPQEQGLLQGALTGLNSLTAVISPPVATALFSYFISPNTPFLLPGVSFFLFALLFVLALGVASRSLPRADTMVAGD